MQQITVGAAVLNQTPLDWAGNRNRILAAIAEAKKAKVSFLALPELCITGYGCEDMFLSAGFLRQAVESLELIIPATKGITVDLGLPLMVKNAVYNTAAVLCDGKLIGFSAKRHLAGDGIHYEPRWFAAWPAGITETVDIGNSTVPVGDLVYDISGVRIGFEICEDGWAADRPGADHAFDGVDLIFNPSASHFAFGKHPVRRRLVQEGSRAFGVTYIYTNLLGNEAGRVIYDGGVLIASAGERIAEGPRFGFCDHVLTTAMVDLDKTRMLQARTVSTRPSLGKSEDHIVKAKAKIAIVNRPLPPRELLGPMCKEEEFGRSVALALFDYLRKSWSGGFILSLSGGADSSAVACLISLMIKLGCQDLGKKGFVARLPGAKLKPKNLHHQLLTCVYQGTKNSGSKTFNAAKDLAEWMGAEFFHWQIEDIVQSYHKMIETSIERDLSWDTDDIPLQNIQARVRAPGVWMLANLKNALLVSTSNRSEAAVGYATMDGDTCGGISPVAGVDKAFLLHWLQWLEKEDAFGLGVYTGLKRVNKLQPTAELRPKAAAQTDEGDLMPYAVLEAIEEAAIRDKKLPGEVFLTLKGIAPDAQLKEWITRFFRLWSRNQWKRERYAPSFHLDDENLDPKTWCRFPILSAGFREDLEKL